MLQRIFRGNAGRFPEKEEIASIQRFSFPHRPACPHGKSHLTARKLRIARMETSRQPHDFFCCRRHLYNSRRRLYKRRRHLHECRRRQKLSPAWVGKHGGMKPDSRRHARQNKPQTYSSTRQSKPNTFPAPWAAAFFPASSTRNRSFPSEGRKTPNTTGPELATS